MTSEVADRVVDAVISIHIPRVGDDKFIDAAGDEIIDFNPHPPRGG